MRQEKITISLSTVELAQIDFLVSKGIFTNRSECIRDSIKNQIDRYSSDIQNFIAPQFLNGLAETEKEIRNFCGIGINVVNLV